MFWKPGLQCHESCSRKMLYLVLQGWVWFWNRYDYIYIYIVIYIYILYNSQCWITVTFVHLECYIWENNMTTTTLTRINQSNSKNKYFLKSCNIINNCVLNCFFWSASCHVICKWFQPKCSSTSIYLTSATSSSASQAVLFQRLSLVSLMFSCCKSCGF